jgi:hypothetical protein
VVTDRSSLVAAGFAGSSGVDVTDGGGTDHVASSDGATAITSGASLGEAAGALASDVVAGALIIGVLVVGDVAGAVESGAGVAVESARLGAGGSAARGASAFAAVPRAVATSNGAASVVVEASDSVVELLDAAGVCGSGVISTAGDVVCALDFGDRGRRAREGATGGTALFATCGSMPGCGAGSTKAEGFALVSSAVGAGVKRTRRSATSMRRLSQGRLSPKRQRPSPPNARLNSDV